MRRFYDQVLDAPTRLRDGTHRTATLDQTWRRFAPKAKRAGITRIADITGLDTLGIPVFTAIRPMGRSLSTQQGKGLTPEAARISALMESLETFTAEQARATVSGSYRALAKKRRVVDVRKLPRATKRLDLDATWRWIEGWDLTANEPVLVPLETVTLDTTFTRPPVFDISSNGLASGNALVEAIVHGLCEVLERDAEAHWRRSGSDRRIVLDTIDNGACQGLIERITRTGARVMLWDLEGRIPAIGCAIVENPYEVAWRPLGVYQGFGAHLLPEIAIARALTEAAQTRLTYIAGGRDDFFPFDYERATDPELVATMWGRTAEEPIDARELPRCATRGLGEDLEVLVALCEQVIAVDLTLPELGVPVAKVIVPGLATDVEALG